jgi:signal transduction histidine kinase
MISQPRRGAHTLEKPKAKIKRARKLLNVVYNDITDRKRLEKELRDSEKRLRCLSQRILAAQKEERKSIAHELRYGLGATLTNIKYRLEQCKL